MDPVNKKIAVGLVIAALVGAGSGYLGSFIQKPHDYTWSHGEVTSSRGGRVSEPLDGARNSYVVQAVEKSGPAVVGIAVKIYKQDVFNNAIPVGGGVGSGVLYDNEGHIITNNHVVARSNGTVQVYLSNGESVDGKVIGADEDSDLAVVKIDLPSGIQPIELGDSDDLHVGEPTIAIGSPLALEYQGTVTTGVISALSRTVDDPKQRIPLLQTDAAINPGNSGGALLDAEGRLIGINSSKVVKEGYEGMGFAIPINEARRVVDSIIKHGRAIRPYLGVTAIDKKIAEHNRFTYKGDGLYLLKVAGDGPAGQAGLRKGDIITAVDGKTVKYRIDLTEALDKHEPGDTVQITYLRGGSSNTVDVTVGSD